MTVIVNSESLALTKVLSSVGNLLMSLRDSPNAFERVWPGSVKDEIAKNDSPEWKRKSKRLLDSSSKVEIAQILRAPDKKALKELNCCDFLGAGTFGTVISARDNEKQKFALKYIAFQPFSIFNARHEFDFHSKMCSLDPPLGFSVHGLLNRTVAETPNHLGYWKTNAPIFLNKPRFGRLSKIIKDFFSVLVMHQFDGSLDKLLTIAQPHEIRIISEKVIQLLQNSASKMVVHHDLKTNNLGYERRGEDLDIRMTDWGKAFDFDVLRQMRMNERVSVLICKYGHLHDVISLLLSCMRTFRRNSDAPLKSELLSPIIFDLMSYFRNVANSRSTFSNMMKTDSAFSEFYSIIEEQWISSDHQGDLKNKIEVVYPTLDLLKKALNSRVGRNISNFLGKIN